MKRRQFIKSMSAAGAMPALPSAVLASGPVFSDAIYSKAIYYTRLWGNSVPEMYGPALGLDASESAALFNRLVADNIIVTPNATGIAKAVSPFFSAPVASTATSSAHCGAISKPTVKQVKDILTDQISEPFKEQSEPEAAADLTVNQKPSVESNSD